MVKLGIDAGAFSIHLAVLSEDNRIIYKAESVHQKLIKETAVEMLERASLHLTEEKFKVCVCGSMSHLLNLPQSNVLSEQTALSLARCGG